MYEYENKKNVKKSKYISNLFSRVLLSIILVLLSAIYINIDEKHFNNYKKYIYTDSLSFNKISKIYNKIFGSEIPINIPKETKMVFNEGYDTNNIEKYEDGYKIKLDNNVINNLHDGIVVYIGDKDNYDNTIVVSGTDGVDIWYGNVSNVNVTLYDYIDKDIVLGDTTDNNLYLKFLKGEEIVGYEGYIN